MARARLSFKLSRSLSGYWPIGGCQQVERWRCGWLMSWWPCSGDARTLSNASWNRYCPQTTAQASLRWGLFFTDVKSLSRLCPVQISCHSLSTLLHSPEEELADATALFDLAE